MGRFAATRPHTRRYVCTLQPVRSNFHGGSISERFVNRYADLNQGDRNDKNKKSVGHDAGIPVSEEFCHRVCFRPQRHLEICSEIRIPDGKTFQHNGA